MEFTFCGKAITAKELKENKWLEYLYYTKENQVNLERVSAVEELSKTNHVLLYVERTLIIADTHTELSDEEMKYVRTALQWSEVSKCGMPHQRLKWSEEGINLLIHNEASAVIFENEMQRMSATDKNHTVPGDRDIAIIKCLIYTHGLTGQYIRGENGFDVHKPLEDLVINELISKESLFKVLYALNHAVIGGVSKQLWESTKDEVERLVGVICNEGTKNEKMPVLERLQRLFAAFRHVDELTKEEELLYSEVFMNNDLWYAESALDTFSRKEINTIFGILKNAASRTKHISFYYLAGNLTYDYEGRRKINVYKKRIVEMCLREYAETGGNKDNKSAEHVSVCTEIKNDTLFFNVEFTRVCDSLITFCVEAERSGIMTYEKSIQTIFDLFGFRRDIFDRLNNEEKYLETMNNAKTSTKLSILEYIKGDSIVDVGSGGGVLLDILESKYPEKNITGTDISFNVIEKLNQKIDEEGHHYQVKKHNFVENQLEEKADTIIFSSILHEVYSYTEWKGERFNIDAVKNALTNACNSLNLGGRIVIRDGIMCGQSETGRIKFLEEDGVSFAGNYIRDFKGLKHLRKDNDSWDVSKVCLEDNVLTADLDFIREALYTYTWGNESYAQEVMEQFGYFTLTEYLDFLKSIGMKIVYSDMFTEQGYPDHLNPLVELLDGLSWSKLPSTCIIAAQKIE